MCVYACVRVQVAKAGEGVLRPRALYRYRSVRGWVDVSKPIPPRPSK